LIGHDQRLRVYLIIQRDRGNEAEGPATFEGFKMSSDEFQPVRSVSP
jgi:hypothetical protein